MARHASPPLICPSPCLGQGTRESKINVHISFPSKPQEINVAIRNNYGMAGTKTLAHGGLCGGCTEAAQLVILLGNKSQKNAAISGGTGSKQGEMRRLLGSPK